MDENISPVTADFLRKLGNDVKTVFDLNLGGSEDRQIVKAAIDEGRMIVTLDSSFGYWQFFSNKGKFGIILLRLSDLTVENVNSKLKKIVRFNRLGERKCYKKSYVGTRRGVQYI